MQTNAKTYWSIMETIFNGRKIPTISPFLIDDKLSSDFKEKANRFNECFIRQCTPLNNANQLIIDNNNRLSSVVLDDQDIIKIIRALKSIRHKNKNMDDKNM